MNKVKCIYIAGYGRSGSTLLDVILSNCAGVRGIGEACNLFDEIRKGGKCSCGMLITECDKWRFINEWLADEKSTSLELLSSAQRLHEGPLGFLVRPKMDGVYFRFWRDLLKHFHQRGEVVADSSKTSRTSIARAWNLQACGAQVKFVHLYRDPDDLLISLSKGGNKKLKHLLEQGVSANTEFKVDHLFLIRSYIGSFFANLAAVVIPRISGMERVFVHYDDLIQSPSSVLARLDIDTAGLDLNSMSSGHAIAGNRMRKAKALSLRQAPQGTGSPRTAPKIYSFMFSTLRLFDSSRSR